MIVVGVGRLDAGCEIARQEVVLQRNAVLQGLVPAFDLALCLRVVCCSANMIHASKFGKLAEKTRRTMQGSWLTPRPAPGGSSDDIRRPAVRGRTRRGRPVRRDAATCHRPDRPGPRRLPACVARGIALRVNRSRRVRRDRGSYPCKHGQILPAFEYRSRIV